MILLDPVTASTLPASVTRPNYDRAQVRTGVVHLGLGAFHKAHQAMIFEAALDSGDLRWGVLGASLRQWLMQGNRVRWFNRAMGLALALTAMWIAIGVQPGTH